MSSSRSARRRQLHPMTAKRQLRVITGTRRPGITRSIWTAVRLSPSHFMTTEWRQSNGWPAHRTDSFNPSTNRFFNFRSIGTSVARMKAIGNGASMAKTVVGFFDAHDEAQRAYDEL